VIPSKKTPSQPILGVRVAEIVALSDRYGIELRTDEPSYPTGRLAPGYQIGAARVSIG
jgi:hypothetical protein